MIIHYTRAYKRIHLTHILSESADAMNVKTIKPTHILYNTLVFIMSISWIVACDSSDVSSQEDLNEMGGKMGGSLEADGGKGGEEKTLGKSNTNGSQKNLIL